MPLLQLVGWREVEQHRKAAAVVQQAVVGLKPSEEPSGPKQVGSRSGAASTSQRSCKCAGLIFVWIVYRKATFKSVGAGL